MSLATPGCTSVTLGGCTIGSNSTTLAQGASTPNIQLNYDALAEGSETVALNASGTVSGGSVMPTNGSLAVTVSASGTIALVTNGLNPRTTIDRGDCLTIAAGQGAAYECGDLRMVYALPATITMNKPRVPTLIYNSRHAKPGALLAANVTYTGVAPLTLEATVEVRNLAGTLITTVPKTFPWSTPCAGIQCRVVVPINATATMPTGIYPVTLQLKAKSNSFTYATSSIVSDTIVIVDRSQSAFGKGWWLDGLEQFVHVSNVAKLWVGGDGSTRRYSFAGMSGSDSIFTASPAYDRPDTLRKVGSVWKRLLGNGAYVEFDNAGHHTRTVNAVGWQTRFAYHETTNGQPLASIKLPVADTLTQSRVYSFSYTLNGSNEPALTSVTTPQASFSRTIGITRTNHYLLGGIVEPDASTTTFAYDGSARITNRRNRLGDTTYFQYDDAGAVKEAKLSLNRTDPDSSITTLFRAAETRSAYNSSDTPTPLAKAYSQLNGPRIDVGDTTNFYVNRWGAPDTVVTALNQRTRLERNLAKFPALVTASVSASGVRRVAVYDTVRALTLADTTLNPYGDGRNAVSTYAWHSVWPSPVTITSPTGEQTNMGYDAVNGSLLWRQPGTDQARRSYIEYHPTTWQVVATRDQFNNRDSVYYDALGNTIKTKTPARAGQPLGWGSQAQRLVAIKRFCLWAVRAHVLAMNPAADLELPRQPQRLPRGILSASEMERVLALPDVTTLMGLRDRAMLETLYSTGIRRQELLMLTLGDLDAERGTLLVREGKGKKDRLIPIGERALAWIDAYVTRVRPQVAVPPDGGVLFLTRRGRRLRSNRLTELVHSYLDAAGLGSRGSCHVFRHTMATLMLEGGADVRYIQEMLGHAQLNTTERYTRVAITHLKAVHTRTHPARLTRSSSSSSSLAAELPLQLQDQPPRPA